MKTQRYGMVFRIKVNGQWAVMLSERLEESWGNATEISDTAGVYSTLGVDQISIVRLVRGDNEINLKDLFSLTLEADGDSTTVAKAIREGVLPEIVEKSLQQWLQEQKNPTPLFGIDGKETWLTRGMLTEKCRIEVEGEPVLEPKAFAEMIVECVKQQYLEDEKDIILSRHVGGQLVEIPFEDQERQQIIAGTLQRLETGYREFMSHFKAGDELWHFTNGEGSFAALAGREGYVILREGKVVRMHVRRMS